MKKEGDRMREESRLRESKGGVWRGLKRRGEEEEKRKGELCGKHSRV